MVPISHFASETKPVLKRLDQYNIKAAFRSQSGRFGRPLSVAFDISGNIFIADTSNGIHMFKPSRSKPIDDWTFVQSLGEPRSWDRKSSIITPGTQPGEFDNPKKILFDSCGNLLVLDVGNSRIQIFDYQLKFKKAIGEAGEKNCQFKNPSDMTINDDGDIIVADQGNSRIQVISNEGVWKLQFTEKTKNSREKFSPLGVAVDLSTNNIVVACDAPVVKIKIFSSKGQRLHVFGEGMGLDRDQMRGVLTGQDGKIAVIDYRVQCFEANGTRIGQIETYLSNRQDLYLGATFDRRGNIVIWFRETYDNYIQFWGAID